MKTLIEFCAKHNLTLKKITYNFQGIPNKRKGYDLVNKDNGIIASFEPVNYSNGDKWFLKRNYTSDRSFPSHFKRISKAILNTIETDKKPHVYCK